MAPLDFQSYLPLLCYYAPNRLFHFPFSILTSFQFLPLLSSPFFNILYSSFFRYSSINQELADPRWWLICQAINQSIHQSHQHLISNHRPLQKKKKRRKLQKGQDKQRPCPPPPSPLVPPCYLLTISLLHPPRSSAMSIAISATLS